MEKMGGFRFMGVWVGMGKGFYGKVVELEDRVWRLEHPPKHKVGDKLSIETTDDKVWLVSKVSFSSEQTVKGFYYREWVFEVVNINNGEVKVFNHLGYKYK